MNTTLYLRMLGSDFSCIYISHAAMPEPQQGMAVTRHVAPVLQYIMFSVSPFYHRYFWDRALESGVIKDERALTWTTTPLVSEMTKDLLW